MDIRSLKHCYGLFLILFSLHTCQGVYEFKFLHYLDNSNVSTQRGIAHVHNIDSNDVTFKQNTLSSVEIKKLKALDFYRMDIVIQETNKKEVTLSTFAKACAVVESKLHDSFNVYLDHNGHVIGVSLIPHENICYGSHVGDSELTRFRTKMYFFSPENGPVPDTLSHIQKLEREREAREKGGPKDNRSFLAKYWMYLVPVAIFFAASGVASNEGQAGGGGGAR